MKAKNNTVMLDAFNASKKVPVNRHRIVTVADPQKEMTVGSGAPGRKKPSPESRGPYMWDMDGRRHKKPKNQPKRVITSNASLHKVDLPIIKPG